MLGSGLTRPLSDCEIRFEPHSHEASVSPHDRQEPNPPYSLFWLNLDSDYIGAVAAGYAPIQLNFLGWEQQLFSDLMKTYGQEG